MKKLLLLLLPLTLASCEKTNSQLNAERVEGAYFNNVIEYGYKGHDYIMFIQGSGDFREAGIVHNPECHCFKDSTNKN